MRHRLGDITAEGIAYGEMRQIGDAQVSFHPAGHVPGSAQIRVEVEGEVWVASGDYKVDDDGLSNRSNPSAVTISSPKAPLACRCSAGADQAEVAAEI